MRFAWLAIALVIACGGKKDEAPAAAKDAAPARDAAPVVVVPADATTVSPLVAALPKAPAALATTATRVPAVVIVVREEDYLIAPGRATWGELAALDPTAGQVLLLPVMMPKVVLSAMVNGAGEAVAAAREFQQALAAAPPDEPDDDATGAGWGGSLPEDVEIDMTYLAPVDDTLPVTTPLIVPVPPASADYVVLALQRVGGVIAVDVGGTVQALRYAAPWADPGWGGAPVPDDPAWDVAVGGGGIIIHLADRATMRKLAFADTAALGAAYEAYRSALKRTEPVVDLLVADGASAQDLVDAIGALHAVGATRIGVGVAPWRLPPFNADGSAGEAGGFGIGRYGVGRSVGPAPTIRFGQPTTDGAMDKAIVRRYLKRNLGELSQCYDAALATRPTLEGTLTLQFTIDARGKASEVIGDGVDPELAACFVAVVKAIEFPKPKQGVVKVAYPLHVRRTGG